MKLNFARLFSRTELAIAATLLWSAGSPLYADYSSLVRSDSPKAYYRFNDSTQRTLVNKNSGTLGAPGDATNNLTGIVRSMPGALAGDPNRAAFFDFTSRTEIPWNPALNPPNTQPFTVEAWFYPASDQTANGQSPLANRFAWSGVQRQGWVFFQRKPDSSYLGNEPVGWNFRMYNGIGTSTRLDVTSLVPYQLGKWTHVVAVYDPVQVTNATVTIYIDGVAANSSTWSGTDPGYAANSNDHPEAPANLAIGNYNNTAGTSLNPYFGGVDEFAFYSVKLTPAQILAHYQNGTNAARAVAYDALIKSHNPVAYLRLDEMAPGPDSPVNLGDLRASGNFTNSAEVRHPAASALTGRNSDGAMAAHNRNGYAVTSIPYMAENNPNAGVPFTFEAWLRPMRDQQGGQCPVNNRWPKLGHRTGWVIFQRFPNASYASVPGINNEGHGWCFRMFDGVTGSGQDVLTATDYTIGKWQHLVVTWQPVADMGDPGFNGNNQWQGVLTAFVDGVQVASNPSAFYAANTNPPEDLGVPADLAIGAYNAASTLGNNPYEGDIDEVAFYNGYVLTPDQILEHYMAGTNSAYGTNYETLVLTAGLNTQPVPGTERKGIPTTYLRFNEPAYFGAANAGTAGVSAAGNLVLTTNVASGPRPPSYPGFDSANAALPLNGVKQWASFNNASGLNLAGQISLEAWIKPDAIQGARARIISHGPPTLCDFLVQPPDNSVTNSSEVFLRLDDSGLNYVVGATRVVYTNSTEISSNNYAATFAVPAGDLGGANWIHLVGTYDGANWRLYRNGTLVATQASPVGALAVDDADWAVGSAGNGWADAFAGLVDEVAIYSYALTATQVAAHYNAATQAARLTAVPAAGGNISISWPYGTLLQSDNATGPWTPVPGNPSSPFTTSAGATRKFYRF